MNGTVLGRLTVLLADGKYQAGGKVAVNVRALQRGDGLASVNVATGDADAVAVTGEFTILLKPGVWAYSMTGSIQSPLAGPSSLNLWNDSRMFQP